ncbi:MAG: phosphoglycerate mutase (2,3-diphosphoglycerate-independent) [Bacteroidia bacterium]|nr:MAG: phosphoglycerate mutase (2,3-diphosphoglycerate-independent) [Bacteroidia bacterium]
MEENRKVLLMILDGWGIGNKSKADTISQANTPNMDKFEKEYAFSKLEASGEHVGLPQGQMGNSEVGHLNIGAGRIVYQDLVKINLAVKNNTLKDNKTIVDAFSYAKEKNVGLHFIGLLSDGGVHSMDTHLKALCDISQEYGLEKVYIHALTDGRDTDPKSGLGYAKKLLEHIAPSNAKVASLVGRYYTMDRDKRWERVKVGYDLMVKGKGTKSQDLLKTMQESYEAGVTDEFIKPIVMVDKNNEPIGKIQAEDVVFCFNFRTDRLREITMALTQSDFPQHGMKTLPLHYLTMTRYDDSFRNIHVVFDKENLKNTLGELIAKVGKKQIRIAETEKYAHVTFFFSGGREECFENETRILRASPKVATYDLQPEMSAYEVKDAIVAELEQKSADFVCLNFANGDMVGHTGIYPAIIKAVEAVDQCVGKVVEAAQRNNYDVIIIADHGNADNAINADGSPNTAHSTNPVPFILISDKHQKTKDGVLADVAPTILEIMGLDQPEEMTGKSLLA